MFTSTRPWAATLRGRLCRMGSLVVLLLLACQTGRLQAQIGPPPRSAAPTDGTPQPADRFRLPSDGTYSQSTDKEIIAKIDELVRNNWIAHEVQGGKPADDGEWCRRAYLDLLGRVPTVAELEAFLKDRGDSKKTDLVDRLLSEDYVEEYARNSTLLWMNTLIGRSGGIRQGSFVNRQGLQQYLREAFLANKPYDQMVFDLISATGASRPGHPDFNGAVNFLGDKLAGAGITAASLATARTSEIFMGVRLQCVQCHDHPFNDWKQSQYWELNSFFRQAVALRRFEGGQDPAYIELADQDFADEGGDPAEAEVFYEGSNRVMRVAYPVFTDKDGKRTEIAQSGYVDDVNRRLELAKLIVYSGYLPDAMVNATWARFLGYGFTRPLDDMGPHNRPINPELLDHLSREFRESGYNVKRLVKWVVLSLPYSLDDLPTSPADDPKQGTPPLFTYFYVRQMQPEELYESLLAVTEGPARTREEVVKREADCDDWVANLVLAQLYVTENKEATTFDGSIPQTLMMFNGELTRQATSTAADSFLRRLAEDSRLSDKEKIDYLFLSALARKSTKQEQAAISELWQTRGRNRVEALQDVWWSLLNANEFILNH